MVNRFNRDLAYTVQKQFRFFGVLYEVGDSFIPSDVQCPPAKLRMLLEQRLLTMVAQKEDQEEKEPAKEKPAPAKEKAKPRKSRSKRATSKRKSQE